MGATQTCRVCGKEYKACHTNKPNSTVFRWQDVACCPEHGSIYIARIRESRKVKPAEEEISEPVVDMSEILSSSEDDESYFDDDENNEFNECFSDYEEDI